jgi:hypothetical protein
MRIRYTFKSTFISLTYQNNNLYIDDALVILYSRLKYVTGYKTREESDSFQRGENIALSLIQSHKILKILNILYLDCTHDNILYYNTSLMIQILSCVPALTRIFTAVVCVVYCQDNSLHYSFIIDCA